MKYMKIKNVSDKDILNYRIEEALLDHKGEIVIDPTNGDYKKTGNTLEWSIKAGEEMVFPAYTARYLKKIYEFLETDGQEFEVEEHNQNLKNEVIASQPENPEAVSPLPPKTVAESVNNPVCKFCGRTFKHTRALGMHIGVSHPHEVI